MNGAARKSCQKSPRTALSLPLSRPVETGADKFGEGELRIFIDVLGKKPGRVATIVFVAISVVLAVTAASLAGRVERLESELKLLKSDLDHPRVRPLASTLGEAARPPK